MATACSKTAPKYGTHCKSCSLKFDVKFNCKCWQNRTASVVAFTLLWRPCVLGKLLGEMDTWFQSCTAFWGSA